MELVSLPHFGHDFWKKYFSPYILLNDQISLSGCLYSWDIGQYVTIFFFLGGGGVGLLTEDFKDKLDIDLKIFLSMVYLAHLLNWYKLSETVLRFLLDKD